MVQPIHPETTMGTVHLKVSDLGRSVQFYTEVIGLKILSQNERIVELTADGLSSLVTLEKLADAVVLPRREVTGLYHFAILVPTRKDLSLSLRQLLKQNIRIGRSDHLVSEALYIADPENNGIEIYVDRPRSEWKYDAQGKVIMALDPIDMQGLIDESGDQVWNGLAPDTTVGHVHLHVANLDEAYHFYCEILGFNLMTSMQDSALFVSAGGYHHHLGLNVWAGIGAPPPPANAVGLHYYTIVLPNQAGLEAVLAKLNDAGVATEAAHGGWFAKDPSQNKVLFITK